MAKWLRVLAAAWLLVAAPALASADAPASVDRLTLARQADGNWIADYHFAKPARFRVLLRTRPGGDGKSWRAASWAVQTPGVALVRIGYFDVLAAEQPVDAIRIKVAPYSGWLKADYTPALAFSDGGVALFAGHFDMAGAASADAIKSMPSDLNGQPIDHIDLALTVSAPGRALLANGRSGRDSLSFASVGDGFYVYSGAQALTETPSFAGVIDAGLPPWVRRELDSFLPKASALYATKLGRASGGRPMALVAWQGAETGGISLGGSVLDGMVVMQISGKQVLTENPLIKDRLRWFFAHESAHFWLGQTVDYARRTDAWITEGGADWLANQAVRAVQPDYSVTAALQTALDECLKLVGPGQSLGGAEERGDNRAQYACGSVLFMAADAQWRQRHRRADAFAFTRELIRVSKRAGHLSTDTWIGTITRSGASAALARAIRALVEQGVPDPAATWLLILNQAGITAQRSGDRVVLAPAASS